MSDPREGVATESRPDVRQDTPRMWRVLLHNDDYTTQEFVVWVLEEIFRKPPGEARTIMLSVHQSGLGVAGVYTHDVASTKVQAATQAAESQDFPLLVTMEPDADGRSK